MSSGPFRSHARSGARRRHDAHAPACRHTLLALSSEVAILELIAAETLMAARAPPRLPMTVIGKRAGLSGCPSSEGKGSPRAIGGLEPHTLAPPAGAGRACRGTPLESGCLAYPTPFALSPKV